MSINIHAWADAINRNRVMDAGNARKIMIMIRTAYERLKSGKGTDDDFDRLAATINVGLIRAESIDPLLVKVMNGGVKAMCHADQINASAGRYGFSGPDLVAINEALDVYEEILTKSTPGQMESALKAGMKRMRDQVSAEIN